MADKRDNNNNNEEELVSMSLGDHLEELQARLILAVTGLAVAFVLSLIAGKWFLAFVLSPYQRAIQKIGADIELQAIEVAEPFLVYLKASLVLAVLLSSPWLFYQLWAFISAGLYKHERRFVRVAAPASALLFIAGVLLFLLGIAPLVFGLFARFKLGVEFTYRPQISNAVSFIFTLSLVFGLAFQTPILIIFSERMGLVKIETLCRVRKYVFLASFVVGAILTPPDVISQIALAVPLYILYEGSILVCRFWRKKPQK